MLQPVPEIPFLFVKAWQLSAKALRQLERTVARLPNVELVERTTDMRAVYANQNSSRPQSMEEAWGRVATEAHYSGIPVLASRVGELQECRSWGYLGGSRRPHIRARELKRMWNNDLFYQRLTAAALNYSRRSQIAVSRQMDELIAVAEAVVGRGLRSC